MSTAGAGSHLLVSEAKQLTTSKAKLPTNPVEAGQKLQAFSIAVDVHFGVNHRPSVSLQACTCTIFATMMRSGQTFTELADAQHIIKAPCVTSNSCRTLAEANAVDAPTFEKAIEAVHSH